MRTLPFATILLASAALGACATTYKPPVISYDETPRKAVLTPDPPKPVRIVELPRLLPLPGQLKPIPGAKRAPSEPADPHARVDQANGAARMEPTRAGYLNAIQVYPWSDGALYQVYAAPGEITDIALETGEQLVGSGPVAAGDTVRWIVGDTESGGGAEKRTHILVKPTRPDLVTNLVVNTDRRTYHLELRSDEKTYMASVSWAYPQDQPLGLARASVAENAVGDLATDPPAEAVHDRTHERGTLIGRKDRDRVESAADPPFGQKVAADRPVDWLISASPMATRRWLAKPSWMLRVRPSRASSLAWARSPGYDAIVIVEPLDRLIGLLEALGVMTPDRFGNVMHAIRPKEEVPAENVPPEQIHHLGLEVGGRRAGRGHLPKPRSRPPIPNTHAALPSASVGIGTIEQTRGSPLGYLPAISTVRLPLSIAIAIRRR
jgi:type IV secretion system protein TrbG